MMNNESERPTTPAKRQYNWPWFVLGGVLLAIVLAVMWMRKEVQRARLIRELNAPAPQTNSAQAPAR